MENWFFKFSRDWLDITSGHSERTSCCSHRPGAGMVQWAEVLHLPSPLDRGWAALLPFTGQATGPCVLPFLELWFFFSHFSFLSLILVSSCHSRKRDTRMRQLSSPFLLGKVWNKIPPTHLQPSSLFSPPAKIIPRFSKERIYWHLHLCRFFSVFLQRHTTHAAGTPFQPSVWAD